MYVKFSLKSKALQINFYSNKINFFWAFFCCIIGLQDDIKLYEANFLKDNPSLIKKYAIH